MSGIFEACDGQNRYPDHFAWSTLRSKAIGLGEWVDFLILRFRRQRISETFAQVNPTMSTAQVR